MADKIFLSDLEATDPRPAGIERIYQCPICEGKERSFHVNTSTGLFNCKRASCNAAGKLADFWKERPKLNHQQRARVSLARAFGANPTSSPAKAAPAATDATWRTHFDESQPIAGTAGIDYLARRGISGEVAEVAALRLWNYHDRLRVLFPFQRDGETVAFQSRAIDGAANGHIGFGSKSEGIFQTSPDALKAGAVIICEAPIDALSITAAGFDAIALGGVTAGAWLARALAFKKVLLAFDNDANGAGDKAAADIAPILQSFGATTARLAPPRSDGAKKADWNEVLQTYGVPIVKAFVASKIRLLDR